MSEEKIVEDFDQFWESEGATFEKFMDIFEGFISEHKKEIWDIDEDDGPGVEFYLNKGFSEKDLDNFFQELYKDVEKLLGEPTLKKKYPWEGIYLHCLEWNYPTHSYCMRFEYVYDGYEEMHYDINVEDYDYEEDYYMDYEVQEMLNHRVCCGLRINGAY